MPHSLPRALFAGLNPLPRDMYGVVVVWMFLLATDADGAGHIRVGKLNLVDLAGSERQSKTGATGKSWLLLAVDAHSSPRVVQSSKPLLSRLPHQTRTA